MKKRISLLLIVLVLLTGCQSDKDNKTLFLNELFTSSFNERYSNYKSELSNKPIQDDSSATALSKQYHKGLSSKASSSCLDDIILNRHMEKIDRITDETSCKIVPKKITFKSVKDSCWDYEATVTIIGKEGSSSNILKGQIQTNDDGLISSLTILNLNSFLQDLQP